MFSFSGLHFRQASLAYVFVVLQRLDPLTATLVLEMYDSVKDKDEHSCHVLVAVQLYIKQTRFESKSRYIAFVICFISCIYNNAYYLHTYS